VEYAGAQREASTERGLSKDADRGLDVSITRLLSAVERALVATQRSGT